MTMHFFHVNGVYHPFTCLLSGAKATFVRTSALLIGCFEETQGPKKPKLSGQKAYFVSLEVRNVQEERVQIFQQTVRESKDFRID